MVGSPLKQHEAGMIVYVFPKMELNMVGPSFNVGVSLSSKPTSAVYVCICPKREPTWWVCGCWLVSGVVEPGSQAGRGKQVGLGPACLLPPVPGLCQLPCCTAPARYMPPARAAYTHTQEERHSCCQIILEPILRIFSHRPPITDLQCQPSHSDSY